MSGPNPFDLLLDQMRQVFAEELAKALEKRSPAKLRFDVAEAAAMLKVKKSWLAGKVRAKEVPHQRSGRLIYFTQQDIDQILSESAVPKNGK